MVEAKKNINIEIDEVLWYDLKKNALNKRVEFHVYIRSILQKAGK